MNNFRTILIAFVSVTLIFSACKKEPLPEPDVPGCMDETALNYNASATIEDGTCEYPATFLPLTVGNTWLLKDEINIFIPVQVEAEFNVTKDTVINGTDYTIMEEHYSAAGFGEYDGNKYGYREASNGNVYRVSISADSVGEENMFINYPLEIGKTWFDTEAQDNIECEVLSYGTHTVPAGTFTAYGVSYTRVSDGFGTTIYMSEDNGIVKVEAEFDFQGQTFNVEFELDSYTVN